MIHTAADGLRYRLQWDLAALRLMPAIWRPGGWLVNALFGGDAAHWAGIRMIAWWPLRRPVLVALPPALAARIRSWRIFCEYFWRSFRAHKKRGNRAISRRSLVECWRMADCARTIVAGPPYRMRWVDDAALRAEGEGEDG